MDPAPERLQKILARTGLGSRRTIESWIKASRVSVNGRIAQLGGGARAKDRIAVDWVPLDRSLVTPRRVLAYY
ncbi:MAG TPA: S4 domain-containing protein, partial [Gammaproteobacteria bacterium]|nr:S4 domain-containing protein [Gammaproteobacteria bacterium]